MDLAASETLTAVAADTAYAPTTAGVVGPGTFVYTVAADIITGEHLDIQLFIAGTLHGNVSVIETVSVEVAEGVPLAGYQSVPVPLVDDTWNAGIAYRHDGAAARNITIGAIRL